MQTYSLTWLDLALISAIKAATLRNRAAEMLNAGGDYPRAFRFLRAARRLSSYAEMAEQQNKRMAR